MDAYYRAVVRFAPLTIILTTLLVSGAAVFCYLTAPPPDIDDPSKGSDPRGTPIKGRANSLAKFFETDPAAAPDVTFNTSIYEDTWVIQSLINAFGTLSLGGGSTDEIRLKSCNDLTDEDKFNVVFQATQQSEDMKSLPILKAMCDFEDLAREEVGEILSECPVHSVGFHMAQLTNMTCQELEEIHLEQALQIIASCSEYYHDGTLTDNCVSNGGCPGIPGVCSGGNSVYIILHYLTDVAFMNDDRYKDRITYSQMVFPLSNVSNAGDFYYWLKSLEYDNTHISLIATDPEYKLAVYKDSLRNDLFLFIFAMGLIVFLVYIYVWSLFVTISLVLDVAFSYGLAYFLYFVVFRIEFFPFINLMAGLLVIALAADSLFLFCAAWAQAKSEMPSGERWQWLKTAMKHVSASVTITSLTTAGALYVNALSPITNLRCFAIFTGTCIMCNLVLVLVFLPAVIVIDDIIKEKLCSKCTMSCACLKRINDTLSGLWNSFFSKVLPLVIVKGADVCLLVLIGLGIWGFVSVYYKPKFEVPTTSYYQLFNRENLMEIYEVEYKDQFRFELTYDTTNSAKGLPVFFVWGLDEKDNGNFFNPNDNGTLIFDKTFDISLPTSQLYLAEFCRQLRGQSFVAEHTVIQPCLMDLFLQFMSASCNPAEKAPCCGQKSPVSAVLFDQCFPIFVAMAHGAVADPNIIIGTPFFDKYNQVETFMMIVSSTQEFVQLFKEMDTFYKKVTGFIDEQKDDAPANADNVWMTSYFQFYNMQLALVFGAYVAFGSSIGIAFVIVLLTTRNIILTFYTLTSITLAIFVTVGSLVWVGWELNVLESFILSLAVGLSVDFTIHYGVAYTLSTEKSRAGRVTAAFGLVGSPVAMAALTTFMAGVAMIPASVRGYQQVGEFLMLAMVVSWAYATFFFQSLCRNLGPQEDQGTLRLPCQKPKKIPRPDAEQPSREVSGSPENDTRKRNRRGRNRQKRRQQQQTIESVSSTAEGTSQRTASPTVDPHTREVVDSFFMDDGPAVPPKQMFDDSANVAGPSGYISTIIDDPYEGNSGNIPSFSSRERTEDTTEVSRHKQKRRRKREASPSMQEVGASRTRDKSRGERRQKPAPDNHRQTLGNFTHSTPAKHNNNNNNESSAKRTAAIPCISSNITGRSMAPMLSPSTRASFHTPQLANRQFTVPPQLPPFVAYDLFLREAQEAREHARRNRQLAQDVDSNSSSANLISISTSTDSSLLT